MSSLFAGPKIKTPPPKELPPPNIEGPEVQAAREKQRKQAALAQGRASTMATGPLGLTGPAPVLRQTLGGS